MGAERVFIEQWRSKGCELGVGAVHSLSGEEEEEVSLSSVVLTIGLCCVQEEMGWRSCLPTPWEGGGGSKGRGAR